MSACYSCTTDGGTSFVSFVLLRSSAFIRSARKILKKQPDYVHELQNLYYALTKKELTLNNK